MMLKIRFRLIPLLCCCIYRCCSSEITTINSNIDAFSNTSASTETVYTDFTTTQQKNNASTVIQKWLEFEDNTKYIAKQVVKALLPILMEKTGNMNISANCRRDVFKVLSGVQNVKPWAFRFVDSSAKIVDGILDGSISNFGSYDECVNTEVRSTKQRDKGKILFTGQYCTINMKAPLPPKPNYFKLTEILPELKNFSLRDTIAGEISKHAHFFYFLTLRMGICAPSSCSLEDVDSIAKLLGDGLALQGEATRCEVKTENVYNNLSIIVMFAYSIAGALVLIGSIIDIQAYYRKIEYRNIWIRILIAFSLFTNFQKLVNTETSSDTLSCLNGIRFLCMSWIILGHTYLIISFQMIHGLRKIQKYGSDFAFQAIVNATVSVDTFFCIGGLLVCYITIKLCRLQGHKLNVGLYVFHRLWRILPAYIYVILFVFLLPLFGSGPLWYEMTTQYTNSCYKTWWSNLIFINNFYEAENMCLPHTWYIASDCQLYIAALIVLIPMIRWPRVGLFLCVIGILASVFYSGLATYINDYPPTMLYNHPDPQQRIQYWVEFYFQPFAHASPYCIGLITGYILATNPKLKIPLVARIVGWCFAFVSGLSVVYGVLPWNRGGDPTLLETILYSALSRTAWTLGVAWMIVCCATGHGGIINYVLSWKAFIPLGRLTYVAYLIHPIVQFVAVGQLRTLVPSDHSFAVWIYFGHLCVTYLIAFGGSMLIEAPFLAVEKIILPREKKKTESSSLVKQNNILDSSLKSIQNGDVAAIIPKTDDEIGGGVENKYIVYSL